MLVFVRLIILLMYNDVVFILRAGRFSLSNGKAITHRRRERDINVSGEGEAGE